jgi:hypothetical protein
MYCVVLCALTCCALALAGCHSHPLHEDVTELTTAELVQKIQCEAADFIKNVHPARGSPARLKQLKEANEEIRNQTKKINDISQKIPPGMDHRDVDEMQANVRLQAQQLLQALRENPSESRLETILLEVRQLSAQFESLRTIANALKERDTEIANLNTMQENRGKRFGDIMGFEANDALFAFVFTITEANDASAGATMVWPIPLGTLTLTGGLTDKRSRLGERKVNLVLTFGELNTLPCDRDYYVDGGRAHRYPITGTIGLDEVFTQYLSVVKADAGFGKFDAGGKSFSDRITFTTEFGGSLKPSMARKVNTRTLNTNLDLAASRKDVHELTMFIRPVDGGGKATVTTVQEIVIRRMPSPRIVRMPP